VSAKTENVRKKEIRMKKRLAIGLAGIMMISALMGCGKSQYLLDVEYSDYVTLCEYKGVEADKVVFDVSDDEIQEEIDSEMYDYATYDDVTDRGVESGDYVVIDYDGKLDGEESEDYSGEDEEIVVGEEYFYTAVEEALIGMKPGDSTTVEFELTEDFAMDEDDEGKTVSMDVTVNSISEENLPELNDEFVQENMDYDSVEAYTESVKKSLMESKEEEYKSYAVSEIMDYLMDNSTFNGYPQELYDECEEYYDAQNESYASMYGMEVDEFLDLMGIDDETKEQDIEDNVNYELVIGAIAQAEGIDCTESEIEKYVTENYEDFGYDSEDDFYDDYSKDDVGYQLIYEKVTDFLYENATYVEIDEATYLEQEEYDWDYDEDEEDSEDAEEEEADEASSQDASEQSETTEASSEDDAQESTTQSEEE
jgi:trigger factor